MARRTLTLASVVLSASAWLFAPHSSGAAPKTPSAKSKAPPKNKAALDALAKELAGDEDHAVAALQSIGDENKTFAAPLVSDLLARGGTEKVLAEALKTAAKLKVESLSASVAPYTQHRAEEVRRQAARTLIKTKGPAAVDALDKALRSEDAMVRGTAASGLGELGAHAVLPDLFRAFDHGVPEAGAAIGQLCNPAECEDYESRTGRVAFDIMSTGFDQILFRPPTEIPDDAKLKLVGRLRELGTQEVGKYLSDVSERWPKDWSKRVKQAIDSAAHAVGGGVKGK